MKKPEKKFTRADIERLLTLARIRISDNLKTRVESDIKSITSYMDTLSEVNIDEIEPTIHAANLTNVLRDDVVKESSCRDQKWPMLLW